MFSHLSSTAPRQVVYKPTSGRFTITLLSKQEESRQLARQQEPRYEQRLPVRQQETRYEPRQPVRQDSRYEQRQSVRQQEPRYEQRLPEQRPRDSRYEPRQPVRQQETRYEQRLPEQRLPEQRPRDSRYEPRLPVRQQEPRYEPRSATYLRSTSRSPMRSHNQWSGPRPKIGFRPRFQDRRPSVARVRRRSPQPRNNRQEVAISTQRVYRTEPVRRFGDGRQHNQVRRRSTVSRFSSAPITTGVAQNDQPAPREQQEIESSPRRVDRADLSDESSVEEDSRRRLGQSSQNGTGTSESDDEDSSTSFAKEEQPKEEDFEDGEVDDHAEKLDTEEEDEDGDHYARLEDFDFDTTEHSLKFV